MPERSEGFRLGINYWPADAGMSWLARYDPGIVRSDFGRIAEAGMDTIRIFLRWEDVQPEPASVDPATLRRVVDAADAATEAGVELIVTLFTGHMSGVNWIPPWATGGGDGDPRFRVVSSGKVQPASCCLRNWYRDTAIVDAQELLAGAVAGALRGHPAVWAWDLGNESSNCTTPPDPGSAERWLARMTSALRTVDPDRLITVGTHMEDIESERLLGPGEAARWCDFVCMHGYPIYARWASGPTDPDVVPFLAAITGWLAGGAPVLFDEFGHATAPPQQSPSGMEVSEADAAAYAGRTIDELWGAGAIGAMLWCYSDYASELWSEPPFDVATHERTFGLWRADRTPKPSVAEVRARRDRVRRSVPSVFPWLDVTVEEFLADRRPQLIRLFGRYRQHASSAPATTAGSPL